MRLTQQDLDLGPVRFVWLDGSDVQHACWWDEDLLWVLTPCGLVVNETDVAGTISDDPTAERRGCKRCAADDWWAQHLEATMAKHDLTHRPWNDLAGLLIAGGDELVMLTEGTVRSWDEEGDGLEPEDEHQCAAKGCTLVANDAEEPPDLRVQVSAEADDGRRGEGHVVYRMRFCTWHLLLTEVVREVAPADVAMPLCLAIMEHDRAVEEVEKFRTVEEAIQGATDATAEETA